ncbi:EB module, partial [Cooperia oncophora]
LPSEGQVQAKREAVRHFEKHWLAPEDNDEQLLALHSWVTSAFSTPTVKEGCSAPVEIVNACQILSLLKIKKSSPEINPGEAGCVDSKQCDAVWPDAVCSVSGACECPSPTVPSRTRFVVHYKGSAGTLACATQQFIVEGVQVKTDEMQITSQQLGTGRNPSPSTTRDVMRTNVTRSEDRTHRQIPSPVPAQASSPLRLTPA